MSANLFVSLFVVILSVLIHYEFLYTSSKIIPTLKLGHRIRVLVAVFVTLFAHIIEIILYGIVFYIMSSSPSWGHLEGNFDGSLLDSIYFSFTNFSTLGYGDIAPLGDIRLLVGLEGIVGFILITWSATYLFFEMQNNWNSKD